MCLQISQKNNNSNNNSNNDDSNHNNKNNDNKRKKEQLGTCVHVARILKAVHFLPCHQVAVSSLEAIRRIFGVGELSYILFLTELLMCIMIGLQ